MKAFFLVTLGVSTAGLAGSALFHTRHGAAFFIISGLLSLVGYWGAYRNEYI